MLSETHPAKQLVCDLQNVKVMNVQQLLQSTNGSWWVSVKGNTGLIPFTKKDVIEKIAKIQVESVD